MRERQSDTAPVRLVLGLFFALLPLVRLLRFFCASFFSLFRVRRLTDRGGFRRGCADVEVLMGRERQIYLSIYLRYASV
jgi:hypothetical protein